MRYFALPAYPVHIFNCLRQYSTVSTKSPIVHIDSGTFYRNYPSGTAKDVYNPALFPGLKFSLPSFNSEQQHWAIIGPSNAGKTTFLQILRGQHLSLPPKARSFPYLSSDEIEPRHRNPARALQYVGFDGERGGVGKSGTRGAYLSARYESRRENTDFSVMDFLNGNTDLNPSEEQEGKEVNDQSLNKVIDDLKLGALVGMPMGNLSNGQTRRARIARALLGKPMVLLLDEPFMGLDPSTMTTLLPLLHSLAEARSPRLLLALRPQDPLPDWITHLVYLGPSLQVSQQGERKDLLEHGQGGRSSSALRDRFLCNAENGLDNSKSCTKYLGTVGSIAQPVNPDQEIRQRGVRSLLDPREQLDPSTQMRWQSRAGLEEGIFTPLQIGEPLVEMQGILVKYGNKEIIGNWTGQTFVDSDAKSKSEKMPIKPGNMTTSGKGLWWTVRRGERWGMFGPNGSGKTTLISLICSDHPQSYWQPIKIFGQNRLPQPGRLGISIFDIQSRIGQSSPEIHAFFPRRLSIRKTIENAWADTFLGTPYLSPEAKSTVDACLSWFEAELNPASSLSTSADNDSPVETKYSLPKSTDWADKLTFGEAPFSTQRVALFLRAVIKKPDLVVLDEAFNGMDDYVRDKCMLFLTWGETRSFRMHGIGETKRRAVVLTLPQLRSKIVLGGLTNEQALICVSHVKEEVPGVVRQWICLPEAGHGKSARFGTFPGPLEGVENGWNDVWGSIKANHPCCIILG